MRPVGTVLRVAHDRKFRFGTICPSSPSGDELISQARRIEDLGYSTYYVPDHFVDCPLAPIPTMAAVAAATTTLRVGSLVLCNDYKHPAVVATEIADDRRDLQRPRRARDRRGMDDRRLRTGGYPPRSGRGPHRAPCGERRRSQRALCRWPVLVRREVLHHHGSRRLAVAGATSPPPDHPGWRREEGLEPGGPPS